MGGSFIKAFKKAFLGHRDMKILIAGQWKTIMQYNAIIIMIIAGLEGAGKSSMLHHIKFGVNGYCNPTHGMFIQCM